MSGRIALFLPTLEGGGAERAFVDLANDFVDRGVDVDVVLGKCFGPFRAELSPKVAVIDLDTRRWTTMIWRLARYLRRARPDCLLSALDPANVVAVLASAMSGMLSRCVISQRSVITAVWSHEFPRSWRFWMAWIRLTYPRARLVICNSRTAATELARDFGVDSRKCRVILNGVDINHIAALAAQPITDPWVGPMAPPLVLSVGRLMTVKDMPTVVRAFALVRRERAANLLILGEGVERGNLEMLVRDLGLEASVRMPGFSANPFPWIAASDVLVSGSLTEGCPNVILQALACGTPIVATDCPGGSAEVLENGRWGRLVPTQHPRAMADAILETLADPHPPDGRIRARDFDRSVTADRYLQLLLPRTTAMHDARGGYGTEVSLADLSGR